MSRGIAWSAKFNEYDFRKLVYRVNTVHSKKYTRLGLWYALWKKDKHLKSISVMSLQMTKLNGYPVSQEVWHAKEPSLLNCHKCRTKVKFCSPLPIMVTSPNEWKILECDEKLQTNRKNLNRFFKMVMYRRAKASSRHLPRLRPYIST